MFNQFIARWNHVKSIGKTWQTLVLGIYGLFWATDEAIEKWNPLDSKTWWDAHTTHLPSRWEVWLIGFLIITVLLVLEGSFRHAKQFSASNTIDEHDPKIYFEPLNSEFIHTNLIPFDMSNRGQRVNVAHKITVQPIALLPSVTFDYVDHLDMNEHQKLLPVITPPSGWLHDNHNILGELERASLNAGQRSSETNAELPFEIIIKYEDVSGCKKFETKVSLVYSMGEHLVALTDATGGRSPHGDFKIIKVVDTAPRRLS